MKKLICTFLLFTLGCGKPYVSSSLQGFWQSKGKPEIMWENPIGEVEVGVQRNNTAVFVRHMSSLSQCEEGKGYNSIGVEHKIYLEDIWKVIKCK